LSNDDDIVAHPSELDVSVAQKGSTADDAGVVGTTSAVTLIPGPIGASAPSNRRLPIINWVPMVPPVGGHG
jgi:hypothetical protein